jgi:hypothetical protein
LYFFCNLYILYLIPLRDIISFNGLTLILNIIYQYDVKHILILNIIYQYDVKHILILNIIYQYDVKHILILNIIYQYDVKHILILNIIYQYDVKHIMKLLIKTIASVLKVSTYIITIFTSHPIRLAVILTTMFVSSYQTHCDTNNNVCLVLSDSL